MSIANIGPDSRLQFNKSDRLAKALRLGNVSSNEMAEHLGVSRTTISNYINGRTEPRRSVLRDWALRTGVPLGWLETGTVPNDNPTSPVGPAGIEPTTSTVEARRFATITPIRRVA